MNKKAVVVGVLLVSVLLLGAAAQNPRWPAIYFSSIGANDADISVVRLGEPATPELRVQLTTSDTDTLGILADGFTFYEDFDAFIVEGATDDAFETTFAFTDPSADTTFTVPDAAAYTLGDTYASWVQGATPADALDTVFYVAPRAMVVKSVTVTWGTAESTGSMDVMVEKLNGVTACASGTDVLAAVVDATATANTTTSPALHATGANAEMAAGDNLCVDVSATPNEIANLTVTVLLGIS